MDWPDTEAFWQWWQRMTTPEPVPEPEAARQDRLHEAERRIHRQVQQLESQLAAQRAMPYFAWWRQQPRKGKR